MDSYATVECVKGFCGYLAWQDSAIFFFKLMPNSLLFFKFFMFLSLFFSVFFVWLIVRKLFNERLAWISVFFGLGFVPLWLFEFAKFENELFAIPLVFLGIYFLLGDNFSKLIGFGFFLLSLFFWLWLGYFFLGNYAVTEGLFLSGFLSLFFGVLFLPFVFFVEKKFFVLLFVFFLLGGFLHGKLLVFLIPFVVVGIAQLIVFVERKNINYNYVWVLVVFLIIGWNYSILVQVPTQNDWDLIDKVIEIGSDLNIPIENDWSFGYWLIHKGYPAKSFGGGTDKNYCEIEKPFVVLTDSNLTACSCEWTQGFSLPTRKVNIWKCI